MFDTSRFYHAKMYKYSTIVNEINSMASNKVNVFPAQFVKVINVPDYLSAIIRNLENILPAGLFIVDQIGRTKFNGLEWFKINLKILFDKNFKDNITWLVAFDNNKNLVYSIGDYIIPPEDELEKNKDTIVSTLDSSINTIYNSLKNKKKYNQICRLQNGSTIPLANHLNCKELNGTVVNVPNTLNYIYGVPRITTLTTNEISLESKRSQKVFEILSTFVKPDIPDEIKLLFNDYVLNKLPSEQVIRTSVFNSNANELKSFVNLKNILDKVYTIYYNNSTGFRKPFYTMDSDYITEITIDNNLTIVEIIIYFTDTPRSLFLVFYNDILINATIPELNLNYNV